jgi:hypothetical protein
MIEHQVTDEGSGPPEIDLFFCLQRLELHVEHPGRIEMLDQCSHHLVGNDIRVDPKLEFLKGGFHLIS